MRIRPRAHLSALVFALFAAACGAAESPSAKAVVLTAVEGGAAAALDQDALLTLRLPARASTGFGWQVDAIDPAVLALVDRDQESASALGGVDVEVLHFAGVAPGHTTLSLAYRRPWAEPDPADPVYSVEVDVAGPYAGTYAPRLAALRAKVAIVGAAPAQLDVCDPGDGSHAKCTPVKDQGACGGCWAFATTGVVENLLYLADPGTVPDLSEQYLISCNTQKPVGSCAGGFIAFDLYADTYRSPPETAAGAVYTADFPYQAKDVACGSTAHPHHEKLSSWGRLALSSTTPLAQRVAVIKQAILDHGPVWVTVCADNAFQSWRPSSGVFAGGGAGCGKDVVNHAVVLTGWDDAAGAWILRNSWSGRWGENGYMRIAYGANAIGNDSAYAVLATGNTPPTASAGPAQAVSGGARVTLDGSGSGDAQGPLASYAWTQLSGPAVTLSGASSSVASFTAPAVTADTVLTFQLTVTDTANARASATTTVTVSPGAAAHGLASTGVKGGCATGGAGLSAWALLALLTMARRRRRA